MNSNEQSHEKNVANFDVLIEQCKTLKERYNPAQDDLQLVKLSELSTRAKAVLAAVGSAKTDYDMNVNARSTLFQSLLKMSTRVLRALAAARIGEKDLVDAREHVRKMRGTRVKPKVVAITDTTSPPAPTTASSSQRGFDSQVKHFREFVDGISKEPLYKPNEADLKVETLQKLVADLEEKNLKAKQTAAVITSLRIERNAVLYAANTGLYDISMAVKNYVISVTQVRDPAAQKMRAIPFKKLA
ncbi:hypothetical protein [Chryseolinea lacunae]|uniref:Uncharacterized protein n=1 Tax=Chryseolinea lacunae TaxID=2801331 RepID=A0ABS1KSW3_9BACT|nr:hypothetical protein [Chryseolinea lacunae]MBL0741366.1 hypothetical protein [Chryseolinea lacunae]